MYFILKLPLPISLLLGSMSTATAPASPVAVIREYKAKGPFTTTLLGVVAIDDAICIVVFGVTAAIARMLLDGTFVWGLHVLAEPAIELAAVTFCELTGPVGTRFAIFSSGEVNGADAEETKKQVKVNRVNTAST